jgi:hypothetical protein
MSSTLMIDAANTAADNAAADNAGPSNPAADIR